MYTLQWLPPQSLLFRARFEINFLENPLNPFNNIPKVLDAIHNLLLVRLSPV